MLATTMQSVVAQALRVCGRTIPSTTSRVIVARRTFLVAPSFKAGLAARGYATATATKKATTAKKPAAKKTRSATSKSAAAKKKPAVKRKVKAKAKKKAAPKKPVKRAKREVSPERKALLLKRELRKKSLRNMEPKQVASTQWMVFLSDHIKGDKTLKDDFSARLKDLSAQFKNLSSLEKQVSLLLRPHKSLHLTNIISQRLQERADQNKVTNAANYKRWVESHSIADVAAANNARSRLRREFDVIINPRKITDERMPKRPLSGFAQYLKAKSAGTTGPAPARLKSLSEQWKTLSASEKKPYEDLHAAEKTKYDREMAKVAV